MLDGLAYGVIALHYAFLLYLMIGGFLAVRWRWTIVTYALTVVWAILIMTTSVPCPLTAIQNHLREAAGKPPLSNGFIELYARGVLYPPHLEWLAQAVVAVLVVTSLILFWRTRRSSSTRASAAALDRTAHRS